MAMAIMNPPTYRKMYLCPNAAVVSDKSSAPVKGKSMIGSREVTSMGIASVIHQVAIHNVEANTATPSELSPSGLRNNNVNTNNKGPNNRPMREVDFNMIQFFKSLNVSYYSEYLTLTTSFPFFRLILTQKNLLFIVFFNRIYGPDQFTFFVCGDSDLCLCRDKETFTCFEYQLFVLRRNGYLPM